MRRADGSLQTHWISLCLIVLLLLTRPARNASAAADDPRLEGYRHPEGWKVEIAASEPLVINPVSMTFGPDGRLFVIEWLPGDGPNDRIQVLSDQDHNGTFETAATFLDHLELPAGLLFWDGWTYLTLDHDVVRWRDRDGDGEFEERETIVSGFGNDHSHHRVSGMTLGPDGWLYLTTGDSDARVKGSDGSTATVLRCGGVFRCRPDGSRLENVAFGMRNPWGNVGFDQALRIIHTDNDNEGSPGFTGCRLLHVVEGGDYGWRLREGARCCAPDFERATWNGGRPGRLGWIAETGRGAPAGVCVVNSDRFPSRLSNLVVYPDVFRKLVRAYRLKPKGASFDLAEEIELLGSDDPLFRPDDAEVGPDGALYILDWRTDSGGAGRLSGNATTGRIYRMTWAGTNDEPAINTRPERIENPRSLERTALVAALSSSHFPTRLAASHELIRRGAVELEPLEALAADPSAKSTARLLALTIVTSLDPDRGVPLALRLRLDRDATLRRVAYDLIGRFARPEDAESALSLLKSTESDPEARRAWAVALGRFDHAGKVSQDLARHLLATLAQATQSGDDPFLIDGFIHGIDRLRDHGRLILRDAIAQGDPQRAQAALLVAQGLRDEDGLDFLLMLATQNETLSDSARAGVFRALREQGPKVPAEPVAMWLSRAGASQESSKVEAIHVLAALRQSAALVTRDLLPKLLTDRSSRVRLAAMALVEVIPLAAANRNLLAIAQGERNSIEERRRAVAALRSTEEPSLVAPLTTLFAQSTNPSLRAELLRTLSARKSPTVETLAKGVLGHPDQELRHTAIALMGQKPSTAAEVLRAFNDGAIPAEDLPRVLEAVRNHAAPELQAGVQTLLKRLLTSEADRTDASKLREMVSRHGDPRRGKQLYLNAPKTGCTTCHRMEGVGGSVGPDLTRVWQTLSFEKRLESLIDPSKEIKEGYGTYKLATTDGRVLTGLLVSKTPTEVVLKDAQGKEERVAASQIEQQGPDPVSLMPLGIGGQLSLTELVDLLAFLGDAKSQESLRSEKP